MSTRRAFAGGERTETPSEEEWVVSAIAWGARESPQPYVLRWPGPDRSPVGLLYTPFIRVAIAARRAADRGETLNASDLPGALVEPVVYVRFYRTEPPPEYPEAARLPVMFGLVPSQQGNPTYAPRPPVWVKEVEGSILDVGAAGTDGQVFHPVAAFPIEAVRVGYDFVVYRRWQSNTGTSHVIQTRARITEEDVRHWR